MPDRAGESDPRITPNVRPRTLPAGSRVLPRDLNQLAREQAQQANRLGLADMRYRPRGRFVAVDSAFHVRVEKDGSGGSGQPGSYFTYWLYPMTGELVEANRLNTTALMSMREWITDVKYEFRTLQGESWHFGIACRYDGGLVLLDVMGEVPASHECECGTGMPLQTSPLTEAGKALLQPPTGVT